MKILSVHAALVSLPLTKPYTIAYKVTSHTEIVLFTVTLANGITGIGAANPFEDVVGETPAQTFQNLQSQSIKTVLKGEDISNYVQLIHETAALFPKQPGTLAAVDIALHDAYCKQRNISVLDLYVKKCEPLPTSVTIGIKPASEMLEEAKQYYEQGFRVLKIKTGLDVDSDIECMQTLHNYFGSRMRLRADANQGYTAEQLQYFLDRTYNCHIELIEQPLPAGEEAALLDFDEATRKIFVADESLLNAVSAKKLAATPQPFGAFNIKLMKCGGILAAREIASIAAEAGIDLFWGCNDESLVSITAALHAAYACPNTKYLDLDGSLDLSRDLATGGFRLENGFLYVLPGAGLGVTLL